MIPGVMAAQRAVAGGIAGGATARYWRIYITENNGDAYTSIQEVELRGTLGGVDLTTPSTTTDASSFYAPGFNSSSKLVDDSMAVDTGPWVSDTGLVVPHWVSFDFGSLKEIRELAVYPQNGAAYVGRAPKAFIVQTSTDGVTWADKKTFSNVTGWVAGTPKLFDLT
jgi:hypothetical protein